MPAGDSTALSGSAQPPPPAYSASPAPPSASDSKTPAPATQPPAVDQPVPPYTPPSILFHLYKGSGIWSKDDIVTGPDKTTVEYYLEFAPRPGVSGWDLTLHRGGREGTHVLTITKGTFSSNFLIQFPNGWSTGVVKTGFLSRSHEFNGWGGSERSRFKWKTLNGGNMKDTTTVVAIWKSSTLSTAKDGSLTIEADYLDQAELILGTGLAMEEWCHEQRVNQ